MAYKEPSLSANRSWSNGIFYEVVIDLESCELTFNQE
jgi:hypothetical protein